YTVEAEDNLGNITSMYFYINIDNSPIPTPEPEPDPEPEPEPDPEPDPDTADINVDNFGMNTQGQQSGLIINAEDFKNAVNILQYVDSNTKSLNLKLMSDTFTLNELYDILRQIERESPDYVKDNTDIITAWNIYPKLDKLKNDGSVSTLNASISKPLNFKMKISADTVNLDNLTLIEIRNGNAYEIPTTFTKESTQNYLNFTLTGNAKIALIYDREFSNNKPNPPTGDTVLFIWSIFAVVMASVIISVFVFWKKGEKDNK
ncbi:MAG: hypothetical protein K0S55_970, partial [Clostridia bacterium]|nr:hypothetical protein [Clostridia bacterium]